MANQTIVDSVVHLDYADFSNTFFKNCKLIYGGGRPPSFVHCTFDGCEFIFEGKALNTMRFIGAIAKSGGGGDDLVVRQFLGLNNWSRNE